MRTGRARMKISESTVTVLAQAPPEHQYGHHAPEKLRQGAKQEQASPKSHEAQGRDATHSVTKECRRGCGGKEGVDHVQPRHSALRVKPGRPPAAAAPATAPGPARYAAHTTRGACRPRGEPDRLS